MYPYFTGYYKYGSDFLSGKSIQEKIDFFFDKTKFIAYFENENKSNDKDEYYI